MTGGGGALLSAILSDQKLVYEAFKQSLSSKTQHSISLCNWASKEANTAVKDIVSKFAELEIMMVKLFHSYMKKFVEHRRVLKQVVEEENNVDQVRLQHLDLRKKVDKVNLKYEHVQRKRDKNNKLCNIENELESAKCAEEEKHKQLEAAVLRLEILKASLVRDSLVMISEAGMRLYHSMDKVSSTQHRLAKMIPVIPTHLSGGGSLLGSSCYPGPEVTSQILDTIAQDIGVVRAKPADCRHLCFSSNQGASSAAVSNPANQMCPPLARLAMQPPPYSPPSPSFNMAGCGGPGDVSTPNGGSRRSGGGGGHTSHTCRVRGANRRPHSQRFNSSIFESESDYDRVKSDSGPSTESDYSRPVRSTPPDRNSPRKPGDLGGCKTFATVYNAVNGQVVHCELGCRPEHVMQVYNGGGGGGQSSPIRFCSRCNCSHGGDHATSAHMCNNACNQQAQPPPQQQNGPSDQAEYSNLQHAWSAPSLPDCCKPGGCGNPSDPAAARYCCSNSNCTGSDLYSVVSGSTITCASSNNQSKLSPADESAYYNAFLRENSTSINTVLRQQTKQSPLPPLEHSPLEPSPRLEPPSNCRNPPPVTLDAAQHDPADNHCNGGNQDSSNSSSSRGPCKMEVESISSDEATRKLSHPVRGDDTARDTKKRVVPSSNQRAAAGVNRLGRVSVTHSRAISRLRATGVLSWSEPCLVKKQ